MRLRPLLALSLLAAAIAPAGVQAACEVLTEPSKAVSDYLANVERAMAQAKAAAAKSRCGLTGTGVAAGILSQPAQEGMRLGGEVVEGWNEVADMSTFLSTWNFYVKMPLAQSDAPEYLYRDNDLLERTHQRIQQLGKTTARKCGLDAVVKAGSVAIKGKAAAKYPAQDATVSDVVKDLLKNNGDVISYYRSVAVGHAADAMKAQSRLDDPAASPFFPDGGAQKIYEDYGVSRGACSVGDSNFQRLVQAGARVALFWRGFGTATKYWVEAADLMSGLVRGKTDPAAEKALLAKELARQGVGGPAADKMLANLDRANDANHAGFTGFMRAVGENLRGTFADFGDRVSDEVKRFKAEADKFSAKKADGRSAGLGAEALAGSVLGMGDADALALDVAADYQAAAALSDNADDQAAAGLRVLVNAHRTLQATYDVMVATADDSAKVCNSQGANVAEAREACNVRNLPK